MKFSYNLERDDIKFVQNLVSVPETGLFDYSLIQACIIRTNYEFTGNKAVVAYLQGYLNRFYNASLKVDGYYGPNTEVLLRKARGIAVYKSSKESVIINKNGIPFPLHAEGKKKNDKYPIHDTRKCTRYFGKPGTNHVRMIFPFKMYYGGKLVKSTYVNKKALESFEEWLEGILDYYGQDGLDRGYMSEYGGVYNNRPVRGGRKKSTHAYACAGDFGASKNRLHWGKGKALFSNSYYYKYFEIMYKAGLSNLGMERGYDWMHTNCIKSRLYD